MPDDEHADVPVGTVRETDEGSEYWDGTGWVKIGHVPPAAPNRIVEPD